MTNGDEVAEASDQADRYQPRFVTAVLACAWLAVTSSTVGSGLMLLVDGSTTAATLMLPIVTMMFLAIPAVIAILVLSIVGGMWRRWVDGIMSAALLAVTVGSGLMFWPVLATQINTDMTVIGNCFASSGPCSTRGSNTDIWIGAGIQAVILAILLVCTSHWTWRLRPEASQRRSQNQGLIALALACAAIVVAIDLNIPTTRSIDDSNSNAGFFSYSPQGPGPGTTDSGPGSMMAPGGQTTLTNDLGHSARVVYCPHQNCSGQQAHVIEPGATQSFTSTSGPMPDSFVVLDDGSGPKCQLADPMGGNTPLSSADAQTCGIDVQTLTTH
ncbi:MAG TPA: hypothetical protein VN108_00320 [Marmoricola sp.]|nr:hypothetical protein [Marmoricola sp.]